MESSEERAFSLWQDRVMRFDGGPQVFNLRGNEQVIRVIENVEDTKGNLGCFGPLTMTNLRLFWRGTAKEKQNLSIGYLTIKSIIVKEAESTDKSAECSTSTLCITARFRSLNYKFMFSLSSSKSRYSSKKQEGGDEHEHVFSLLHRIWNAYVNSKPYREVRLHTAITVNNGVQLQMLPMEKIISQKMPVVYFTKTNSAAGKLLVTNVRIVWVNFSKVDINFSVPLIQIVKVSIASRRRDGKEEWLNSTMGASGSENKKAEVSLSKVRAARSQQLCVAIKTSSYGGDYRPVLCGSSESETRRIYDEVRSLWKASLFHPVLGVSADTVLTSEEERQGSTVTRGTDSRRIRAESVGVGDLPSSISSDSPSGVPLFSRDRVSGASDGDFFMKTERMEGEGMGEDMYVFDDAPSDGFAAYFSPEDEGGMLVGRKGDGTIGDNEEHSLEKDGKTIGMPECCPSIGLAIEPLRKGVTLEDLWKISVK